MIPPTPESDEELLRTLKQATETLNAFTNKILADPDLKELRLGLETATDDLNLGLKNAEAGLVRLYKGRCASVELNENGALVFWVVRRRWGLYLLDAFGNMRPISSASREHRILAAHLLRALEKRLIRKRDLQ